MVLGRQDPQNNNEIIRKINDYHNIKKKMFNEQTHEQKDNSIQKKNITIFENTDLIGIL